jgi:hypothetical protein
MGESESIREGRRAHGWVVTGINNTNACYTLFEDGNTYTITSKLTDGMAICIAGSSPPTGWVVTAASNSSICDEALEPSGNLYTISRPTNDMIVCSPQSPIPAGWTVIASAISGYCLGYRRSEIQS